MQLNHSREGLVQTERAISNQLATVHRSILQLMVNDEWHWPTEPTYPTVQWQKADRDQVTFRASQEKGQVQQLDRSELSHCQIECV